MVKVKFDQVRKRNGELQPFEAEKITNVILKALQATEAGDINDAEKVTKAVLKKANIMCRAAATATPGSKYAAKCVDGIPAVEEIQDLVEESFMELDYFDTAKAFILYRQARKKMRERSLFRKRTNLKPYEYGELIEYVDAIRHSYWVHTEFSYTSDIHDFKTNITEVEASALKNAMLAIAQIEVAVKSFWGDIYKKMPKPEIAAVGMTFAESEVRHMDAYSHLLEILGLNEEFDTLENAPAINKRIKYLDKVILLSKTDEDKEYAHAIALFSLFIEHVSLFSQFLIIMSFNKHRNMFKGISNAVEATSKEEQIHGMFGTDLINIIRKEHTEWFDKDYEESVREMCREAYEAEKGIIDWIFEKGELDFLPKNVVLEFIESRFNKALEGIGLEPMFNINDNVLTETDWFDEEVFATKHTDFFYKRSINYTKRQQSVTTDDLF